MRKLKTSDLFAFVRCMKAVGIKENLHDIAKKSDNAADAWEKGFELIYKAFDLATEKNGEAHVYEFLAGPFEMSPEEVAEMPLPDFFDKCKTLAEENDLAGFFKQAGSLIAPKR